jgi:NitT/TauT family transport system ATP-binding protein
MSTVQTREAAEAQGSVGEQIAVRVSDLVRTFTSRGETVHALGPVSLEVQQGEFIALLGPSGCGKSTLLNVVAGLLPATSGAVEVQRVPVHGVPDQVAMMFQKAVLLPWRNIRDNVLLPIENAGGRRAAKAASSRADELLELVGLSGFADRMPNELSGGMQQRAAICRMLIQEPQLLLLDEPFGALDEFTREYMNMELLKITSQLRRTSLFVTHSISEAVFLADRVVVMSARPGRIAGIVDVDLPAGRTSDIVTTSEFQAYVKEARDLLKGGHSAGRAHGEASA